MRWWHDHIYGRILLLLLLAMLIATAILLLAKFLHPTAGSVAITTWEKLECAAGSSQPAYAQWQACTLPHLMPDKTRDAWYRMTVGNSGTVSYAEHQGIWLAANMNAEVWVNDTPVGNGGRMAEPVARHWNNGLLFFVPHSVLKQESMEVMIHVRGYLNNGSGLNMLMTGPYQALQSMHEQFVFRTALLTFSSLVLVIIVGVMALLLSLWSKQSSLVYFALGCLVSTIYLADALVVNIPMSRDGWEALVYSSIAWSQLLFLQFLFCLMGITKSGRTTWLYLGFYGYGVLSFMLFALPSEYIVPTGLAWSLISSVLVFALMLYSFRLWCVKADHRSLMVGFALFSILIVNLYDAIPLLIFGEAAVPFLFYLGPMFFSAIMLMAVLTRVGAIYQHKMQLSIELGETLKQQSSELEVARRKTEKLWKQQAIRDERDRIVRDLHDGVGGLLSNTLAKVEPKDTGIYTPLNEAVHELRMIMGTLDEGADVASLLGELRLRIQGAVEAVGATLYWKIDGIPLQAKDNTGIGMQFVRIIQESVHNALRHAKGSEITVYMGETELWIVDNGEGFNFSKVRMGRGLKNLRWRAQQLNANFHVISNASGTKISLYWD